MTRIEFADPEDFIDEGVMTGYFSLRAYEREDLVLSVDVAPDVVEQLQDELGLTLSELYRGLADVIEAIEDDPGEPHEWEPPTTAEDWIDE